MRYQSPPGMQNGSRIIHATLEREDDIMRISLTVLALTVLVVDFAFADDRLQPPVPRSDGRVLHVDFENYSDGIVQPLNAGIRWLGDPFSGRKQGIVRVTRGDAFAGRRAGLVSTTVGDEIGRIRLQPRYDAPSVTGETVTEFVFRGDADAAMEDFVIWSARSAGDKHVGLILHAVKKSDEPTFGIEVTHASTPGSTRMRHSRPTAGTFAADQWMRVIQHRRPSDKEVELWAGMPGQEKLLGVYFDLDAAAAVATVELGDTSPQTARGTGMWDDIRVGGLLGKNSKLSQPEPELRDVSQERVTGVGPISVGKRKQLFLDDQVIESQQGLTRQMHPVRKHGDNPLIVPDQPWEGRSVLLYGGVIRDPETKLFRMWYLVWGKHVDQPSFVCYAESADGIHWEKPTLSLHPFRDNTDNNIVLPGWSQTSVVFDPHDTDPERRYKALLRYNGLRGFTSPDGLHWKDVGVLIDQGYDGTTLHWNPIEKQWVAMVKIFKDGKRARGYATSKDFFNWTDTYFMSAVDQQDAADDEMYAMSMFHYETVFIGLLRMYHTQSDVVDIQLATSRNGRHWERPSREPFIPTGAEKGDWDFGNNSVPATPPIRVGDELWFYYAGRSTLHNEIPNDGAIGLATLRLDGFVSMDAADQGTLTTKPLRLAGNQLCLNADASAGSIRVEMLNGDKVVSSKPIGGDAVRHVVEWDTTQLVPDGEIRLRFHLDRAKLYAFWME